MNRDNIILSTAQLSDPFVRSFNPSLIRFDLPTLIENMKIEQSWKTGELKSMILLRSPSKKILLTIVHRDTEISFYKANDLVTFQMIEGEINLCFRNECLTLCKDEVITLNENSRYTVDSNEESAFLLTIES